MQRRLSIDEDLTSGSGGANSSADGAPKHIHISSGRQLTVHVTSMSNLEQVAATVNRSLTDQPERAVVLTAHKTEAQLLTKALLQARRVLQDRAPQRELLFRAFDASAHSDYIDVQVSLGAEGLRQTIEAGPVAQLKASTHANVTELAHEVVDALEDMPAVCVRVSDTLAAEQAAYRACGRAAKLVAAAVGGGSSGSSSDATLEPQLYALPLSRRAHAHNRDSERVLHLYIFKGA